MKKLCIALAILAVTFGAQAQTLPNAGFESWRINSAGGTNPQIVMAPVRWYGADSLIITYGQFFGAALSIPDTVWKAQLFMDSLNVHTGKYSAKMVTKDEDTAGIVSGLMSNAKANVAISLSGFGGISYSGGTAVTQKPLTVSAWVKYVPTDLRDSAFISVQSIAKVAGKDSVVGDVTYRFGGVDAAFRQVTATVEYQPLLAHVDTVRITFGSSFSTRAAAVNSTLYVDDVTMTGEDQAVPLQDMV
ncbi:MAG: hypothetical protein EBZ77_05840, partial [Chitinophagia bacterium]|nr:hypothetical protein [Chitinophagia bacterium]